MNTVRLNRHQVKGLDYERVDAIFDNRAFADILSSEKTSPGFIYNTCLNGLSILRTPSDSADTVAIGDPEGLERGVAAIRQSLGAIIDGAVKRSPEPSDQVKILYQHSIENLVADLSQATQEEHRLLGVMKELITGLGKISGHEVAGFEIDKPLPLPSADAILATGRGITPVMLEGIENNPFLNGPPYRQLDIRIPAWSERLLTGIALLDDTSLGNTIRDAMRWYIGFRRADPELAQKIKEAQIKLTGKQPDC